MSADEFTFPAVSDDYPNFASSPPLWRVPSTEASLDEEECGDDEVKKMWYSSLGGGDFLKRTTISHDDDDDDKMDKLWENFNEELSRISSFGNNNKGVGNSCRHENYDSDGRRAALTEFCCVQALKMPARRTTPSLLLFLRVFKKLFLVQNSHCTHKKTKCPGEPDYFYETLAYSAWAYLSSSRSLNSQNPAFAFTVLANGLGF
ncbi:hypothetical protein Scep_002899 [Stephania cephalantha]|uniref:Uncharacterized protein n=1 Tax=Stephania cephalantha TaxID=152367 RepID=A0AAP0Q5F1_9MAGN